MLAFKDTYNGYLPMLFLLDFRGGYYQVPLLGSMGALRLSINWSVLSSSILYEKSKLPQADLYFPFMLFMLALEMLVKEIISVPIIFSCLTFHV